MSAPKTRYPARILKLSADLNRAVDEHNARREFESHTQTEDQQQATNALKSQIAQAIRTAYTAGLHTDAPRRHAR